MAERVFAFQANECWELAVGASEENGQTKTNRPTEDFRQLKSILRLLEQKIAQEMSTVRFHARPLIRADGL